MSKYELVYIVHPDLENSLEKVTEKISGFIKRQKGVIIKEDIWGKRKLAYPIKKNELGVYVVVNFKADPEEIKRIEKNVLLTEEIIRHLLVKDENLKARPSRERKEKKEENLELEVSEKEKEKDSKTPVKEEKERLKELDEKLEELLGKEE